MNRRRCVGAAGLLLLLLLTGCWDLREMNQLAMVMAVGIDRDPENGRFELTVQIARPSGRGKGGGPEGGTSTPVYIATADGDTIFGAIRNLAQFSSRRIMWAHNNVVIIGESLAREDITPVIDFFTRNQELRMRTWIAVARGSEARPLIAANTGMEEIPANSVSALLRYAQLPGESVRSEVADVTRGFFSKDTNPVMASLMLKPRGLRPSEHPREEAATPQVVLTGSAVVQRNRVVGFVEQETGRGLLWLRREMRNAVLTLPCPNDLPGTLAVEVRSPTVRVRSQLNGSMPTMYVTVDTQGWLSEQGCPTPDMRAFQLKGYVAQAMAKKIEAEMRATLAVLQQDLKTDAIRYGRVVHVQQPAWWRANGQRWAEIFPKVKTQITVNVDIPKMSLYTRPMKARMP